MTFFLWVGGIVLFGAKFHKSADCQQEQLQKNRVEGGYGLYQTESNSFTK